MTTPRKNYRPVQRTNNTKVPYSVNAAELIRMAKDMPVVTGSPGASVSGIGNSYSIVNNLPQRYTIEILSGSNPYVWRSIYDDTANSWATFSDGPSGTTTNIPAYEINGNTTVGAGTYVDGWFGANYEVIYFEFQPNASGATTGGNETITGSWTFSNNVTFTGDTITLGGSGDTTTLILGQDGNDTITVTGDMGFGSTTTTTTAPGGEFTFGTITTAGTPGWSGSLGDAVVGSDGTLYINDGSSWNSVSGNTTKVSYTKTYTDFSTAATSNQVSLFTLPTDAELDKVLVEVTAAFTGLTTPSVGCGPPTGPTSGDAYQSLTAGQDASTTGKDRADARHDTGGADPYLLPDDLGGLTIYLRLDASNNLDNASAGSVTATFWYTIPG